MDAHQTTIYTAILIICLIIGAVLVFFIVSLVRHQRKIRSLYQEKISAEITTLENERSRLANNLHDELGPLLSAVKFKVSSIETHLPEDEKIQQDACDHIVDIIHRMREISNDLLPATLLRKGLIFAIDEFINKVSDQSADKKISGLKIIFRHQNIPELPNDKAVNIYRIIHEIIHNTIKHAKASELTMELVSKDNRLFFISKDNGLGFDYLVASKKNIGLGLRNLQSRSDVMAGNFHLETSPGKGTIYSIDIPL